MTDARSAPQDQDRVVTPEDKFNIVYICMLIVGAGFLTPWSSFIGAIDYFFYYYLREFPAVSVVIPVSYLVTTFAATTINMTLVKRVGLHSRILFGYIMFIISLLLIPLLDIGIHNCTISTGVSFYLTLLTVGMVGLGSGVQQSSYYGLSTMLPKRYTQAVMAGESAAGVIEICFRVVTKVSVQSERLGGILFFIVSLSFIIICVFCYCYIRKNKMVIFYTRKSQTRLHYTRGTCTQEELDRKRLLSTAESIELKEMKDESLMQDSFSESDVAMVQEDMVSNHSLSIRQFFSHFLSVVIQIWPLMATVFVTYFVTLLLFPGLIVEVRNEALGSWTPVLLIIVFNFTDFAAKWFALVYKRWSPKQLLVATICRIVIIPLILLCVVPSPAHPVFGKNVVIWAGILTLVLGLTNGYYSSISFINLSSHVKKEGDKELAGTIMVWVLLAGLLTGALCAYALTPLTTLQDDISTNVTIKMFDLCNNFNITND